jgi:hypothetical protein
VDAAAPRVSCNDDRNPDGPGHDGAARAVDESALAGETMTQTPMNRLDAELQDSDYVTDEEPPYRFRLLLRKRKIAAAAAAAEAAAVATAQAERQLLESLMVFPLSCPIVEDEENSVEPDSDDVEDSRKCADAGIGGQNPLFQRREPVPVSRKRLNAVGRFRARRNQFQDPNIAPSASPKEPLISRAPQGPHELPFVPPNPCGQSFDIDRLAAIRRFHQRRGTNLVNLTKPTRWGKSAKLAAEIRCWASESKRLDCSCVSCAAKNVDGAPPHQIVEELFGPGWDDITDDDVLMVAGGI